MAPMWNTGFGFDFVTYLQFDIVIRIMSLLDDPIDIIRASFVSRTWYNFVINSSLLKNLCVKKAPAISTIDIVIEQEDEEPTVIDYISVDPPHPLTFNVLKKNHSMYSILLRALSKSYITPGEIVEGVVGASSTHSYPQESVVNVLLPSIKFSWGDSYWSSKGFHDRSVPEKIIFKLYGDVCIVTDILIQPFRRLDDQVYSANAVRFRLGHPKSYDDLSPTAELQEINDDDYVWTYTSPEFPMLEEASLQSFCLPEPAICVGGFLQVELLGRAQKDLVNGLYYICLGHVRVLGHTLQPAFDIEIGLCGSISLWYHPDGIEVALNFLPYDDDEEIDDLDPEDRPMSLVQVQNLVNLRMAP